MYWTDAFKNSIETSDLNGGHQYVLAYENGATLNDIVVYGQYLFYTAWQRQRITKMDKLTGSRVNFMSDHPEFGNLYSLDIDADEIQDVNPSCSIANGQCSMFCFPSPTGRTCGCQDNVNLQPDQLTCEGEQRTVVTDQTYLYSGLFAGGAFILVMTIVGLACMMKRRNTSRLSYERTFHHHTLNSVYDTIQDVYEEPIKSFQDGSEGEKNFHD